MSKLKHINNKNMLICHAVSLNCALRFCDTDMQFNYGNINWAGFN